MSTGRPPGYGIYTVNATDVKWSYKGIGEPAGYQFRTYDMNTVKKHLDNNVYKSYLKQYSSRRNDGDDYGTVGENVVYVNVWNYDPAWTVEVKENGVPLPVTRVFDRDPLHTITFDIPRVEAKYEANLRLGVVLFVAHVQRDRLVGLVGTRNHRHRSFRQRLLRADAASESLCEEHEIT